MPILRTALANIDSESYPAIVAKDVIIDVIMHTMNIPNHLGAWRETSGIMPTGGDGYGWMAPLGVILYRVITLMSAG